MKLGFVLSILALIALSFIGPFACSSGTDPDPDDGDGPAWPEGAIALPDEDASSFAEIAARYHALRETLAPAAARSALLTALSGGWTNIAGAEIMADGSSIQLFFSDKAGAVLITDEVFFGAGPIPDVKDELHAAGEGGDDQGFASGARELVDRMARDLAARTDCDGTIVPSSHKIALVNLAAGIKPFTQEQMNEMKAALVALGWDPDDVTIKQRADYDDTSWTPDDLFDQEGYGIVFFMGQGGFTKEYEAEEQHFKFECFRGGNYTDGYQEHVTEERWGDYEDWLADGKLLVSSAYDAAGNPTEEIYARDDLLAEQLKVDEDALVYLATNHGYEMWDELLDDAGAGCAAGWDGPGNLELSRNSFLAMIESMLNEGGFPKTDQEAIAAIKEEGLGVIEVDGETYELKSVSQSPDFYLPSQMSFTTPFDCLEPGTVYYEVELNFPNCPEANRSFQFFPGGALDLTGIPPGTVEISLKAKDSDGKTIAAGKSDEWLVGGVNEIDLCPCEGSVTFDLTSIPADATSLEINVNYADPTIGQQTRFIDLPSTELGGLIPGPASFDVIAIDGEDFLSGVALGETEIDCDGGTVLGCLGWLKVVAGTVPPGTDEIWVYTDSPVGPHPVVVDPGGEAEIYGFWTYEDAGLTVKAVGSDLEILGEMTTSNMVFCGENLVVLDFNTFGIILEASPEVAHSGGWQWVTLTATVREWRDFDTTEPTGDPVPDLLVQFVTDMGNFVDGTSFDFSDAGGEAVVYLVAPVEPGTATLRAFVDPGPVWSEPINVEFAPQLTILANNRDTDFQGDVESGDYEDAWIRRFCTTYEVRFNSWQIVYTDEYHEAYTYTLYTAPMVGDTLTFIWRPIGGCGDPEADPPFQHPFMSSAYLHYFYGEDYDHQITRLITGDHFPLGGTVAVSIILQDPTAGPSPGAAGGGLAPAKPSGDAVNRRSDGGPPNCPIIENRARGQ